MLRILCTVSLLVGIAYGQLIVPQIPDIFPATCTAADQLALYTCAMQMQTQTVQSQEVFQLFGQAVMNGNITEAESTVLLDTACDLLTDTVTCLSPLKDRCFTTPLMAFSFEQYDGILALCAVPHREKYFTQIVKCNKKLDILNTVVADPEILNIINEIVNATTAVGTNITDIMNMSPQFFVESTCRLIRRVGELTPLSKVNATCGQETHDTYAQLYPKLLEMYKCNGHIGVETNTTRTPIVSNTTITIDTNTTRIPIVSNTTITIDTNTTRGPNMNETSTVPPAVNGTSTVAPNTNSTNTPVPGLPTSTVFTNTTVFNNNTNPNPNNTGSYVQPGSGSVVYSLCAILFAIVTVHMRN